MSFLKSKRKPIAIGAAAGVINGLFGAGGGLLLVPLFIKLCRLPPKTAFATSVAVMAALSAVSLTVYGLRGSLDVTTALPYMLGGIGGGILGAVIMRRLNVKWLRLGLALFMFYGGVKGVMLW